MLDSNSTLPGARSPALQAYQPTRQVGVASPVSAAEIRVQKRFGLAHGLAFRLKVHFGIGAGCRDAGVTQPAPDRDQVHTGLQEMRGSGVPQDVGINVMHSFLENGLLSIVGNRS